MIACKKIGPPVRRKALSLTFGRNDRARWRKWSRPVARNRAGF